MEQSKSSLIH